MTESVNSTQTPLEDSQIDPHLAAMQMVQVRAQHIVDLMARVFRKYPAHTVPSEFSPCLRLSFVHWVRPVSAANDRLAVQIGLTFGTLTIPESWFGLQDSQVTRACRQAYWSNKRKHLQGELDKLDHSIRVSQQQIVYHQQRVVNELAERVRVERALEKLTSPDAKKRTKLQKDADQR